MWRLRSMVLAATAFAVLTAGAVIVHAGWGWWWNSTLDVEGTRISTVWQVDDEGGADDYQTTIKVLVPSRVSASILEQAATETVQIMQTGGLACDGGSGTVEAEVWYRIKALNGAEGTQARLSVDLADGTVLASGETTVGGGFTGLEVIIPAAGLVCQ